LQGEAGRNPKEVTDAAKFDPTRKREPVSSFSYGQHECFARDLVTTFIVGLVRLVAGLKGLRPAPGQMGVVKTIRVGSEKAYLNDSWSYLSFDASSMSNHPSF
jgi:linoleate 10R-lipoxygenase